MKAGERLKAYWSSEGLTVVPGASKAQLLMVSKRNDVILPEDFEDYLLEVNGMKTGESDAQFIHFWSLNEIKSVADEEPDFSANVADAHRCLIFADWSICARVYAIQATDGMATTKEGQIYSLGTPGPIVKSFADFVNLYLSGRLLEYGA